MDLIKEIRVIEDFPAEGISFKDITTLLKNGEAFKQLIDEISALLADDDIDLVVGPEARGFVIGAPLAFSLGAGFVMARKPGKLPCEAIQYSYKLEYGENTLQMHKDAIKPGQRVVIVDDLLATGGTALAVAGLVEMLGGKGEAICFAVELSDLGGRETLKDYRVESILKY